MRRQIVLILAAAAVLTAPSAPSLAHHGEGHAGSDGGGGGTRPPTLTSRASSTHHFGFGFYLSVPAESIKGMMPPGFTLEACRPDLFGPLLPGKANVILHLIEADEYDLPASIPQRTSRFSILTCGRPPEDGRPWYRTDRTENTRLIMLRTWSDSHEHNRFLERFKHASEYADIQFQDVDEQNWSFTARAVDGTLIAAASFHYPTFHTPGMICRTFDEILRLWTYDPSNGAFGVFDADLLDVKACYGSPTVFRADERSPVARLFGRVSTPDVAGVEHIADYAVTYSRLF